MKSTANTKPPPPMKNAGRPRNEKARLAILQAAYELLYKAPAHDISVIQIAKQAQVSTATLYRWWPTKEAILLDAFVAKVKEDDIPTLGSSLNILGRRVRRAGLGFQGRRARITLRLLMAIQEDQTLRKAFLQRFVYPEMALSTQCLTEAVRLGDLPADTDKQLVLDCVFGALLLRLMVGHAPINNEVVQNAFDLVVAGAKNVRRRGSGNKMASMK